MPSSRERALCSAVAALLSRMEGASVCEAIAAAASCALRFGGSPKRRSVLADGAPIRSRCRCGRPRQAAKRSPLREFRRGAPRRASLTAAPTAPTSTSSCAAAHLPVVDVPAYCRCGRQAEAGVGAYPHDLLCGRRQGVAACSIVQRACAAEVLRSGGVRVVLRGLCRRAGYAASQRGACREDRCACFSRRAARLDAPSYRPRAGGRPRQIVDSASRPASGSSRPCGA